MPRAAVASMRRMLACATRERSTTACVAFVKLDVIGIATATGDQGLVFETSNGLAYAEFHGSCLN